MMRLAVILAPLLLLACGSHGPHDGGQIDDAASSPDPDGQQQPGDDGAMVMVDAAIDAKPMPDAFPGVLDVRIDCHNDCVLHATPSMIAVSAGTSFQVNWINVGDTDCDVAKIDQFNQVPIIIGLEPGTSYHDPVHDWCGTQFTGTFNFRISICTIPSYIPVDCGA
ncbi:MAG TPA: hypothetical protein VFV99_09560 [Kofleriaceae bacterium]|nr:hypothetical protein [Kofleriaceae bacterium]